MSWIAMLLDPEPMRSGETVVAMVVEPTRELAEFSLIEVVMDAAVNGVAADHALAPLLAALRNRDIDPEVGLIWDDLTDACDQERETPFVEVYELPERGVVEL